MPSTGPIPSVTANELSRALGEAVVRIWSNLPQEASSRSSPLHTRSRRCPRLDGHHQTGHSQQSLSGAREVIERAVFSARGSCGSSAPGRD